MEYDGLGEAFAASGMYYDPDNDLSLSFYALLASGGERPGVCAFLSPAAVLQ